MRTYLAVMDETREARVALRFAARRAAKTAGTVQILALVAPQEFVQWGGVQAALEEEAQLRAEAMATAAAGDLVEELGLKPAIFVRQGDPVPSVLAHLDEHPEVAALVLGAPESGTLGPLLQHFAGTDAGKMPCPVMLIPGSLSDEAIDRLS